MPPSLLPRFSMLRIRTLGRTEALLDDKPLTWIHSHPQRTALLLVLALDGPLARERVSALFWPGSSSDRSRRALNQAVYDLRRLLGDARIVVNGDRLGLSGEVWVDALEFVRLGGEGRGAEALALYRGEFLAGEHLVECAEFEGWAERWNALLRRQHRQHRRAHIGALVGSGSLQESLTSALGWVAVEPDEDEAHHRVLELLAATGDRTEALQHYASYARTLADQGLQPLDETRTLLESLRAGESGALRGPVVGLPTAPAAATARPHVRGVGLLLIALIIGVTGFLLGGVCAGPGAAEIDGRDVGAVTGRAQNPESFVMRPPAPTAQPARGDAKPTDQ